LNEYKSTIDKLKSERDRLDKEIIKNDKNLKQKQKRYEITASDQNIELFNNIKHHNKFDQTEFKSTMDYYHKLYNYKDFKSFVNLKNMIDSEIIDNAFELNELLNIDFEEYILLFRSSRDGFSANEFHKQCDKQGPTVVIIKCGDGSICGG